MDCTINSADLIPVDDNFKVIAGPGAGKTHWLSLHIKNIVHNSKKLGVTRKIACITYTNVGVNTIRERIAELSDFTEVSTIHSFLYKHIIKPYIFLEADNLKINYKELRVLPNQIYFNPVTARRTLEKEGWAWININNFLKGLKTSNWVYNSNYTGEYKPKHPQKVGKGSTFISNQLYLSFVYTNWKEGIISYNDIFYLSNYLLNKHPNIYDYINAKFPYFFMDEFQDSIPPIVDFIKNLSRKGTIIGVVGDPAQTIYGFIGATYEMINDFDVPNIQTYEIHGNRRSSNEIVNLLNFIRTDFRQSTNEQRHERLPILYVGNKLTAYQKSCDLLHIQDINCLAYKNIIANSIHLNNEISNANKELIDTEFDSNPSRLPTIKYLIIATEYAYIKNIKEAFRYMNSLGFKKNDSLHYLHQLCLNRNNFLHQNLYNFYQFVTNSLHLSLPGFRPGRALDFYKLHTYEELAMGVEITDTNSIHKTIHKAKGEGLNNVFLILENLEIFTRPNLPEDVNHRVYYVGMSRAIHNLIMSVESITEEEERILRQIPIEIIHL